MQSNFNSMIKHHIRVGFVCLLAFHLHINITSLGQQLATADSAHCGIIDCPIYFVSQINVYLKEAVGITKIFGMQFFVVLLVVDPKSSFYLTY